MDASDTSHQLFTTEDFASLDLPHPIQQAVEHLGFHFQTQVQQQVLPIAMAGGDVVVQAQTGSGKTAAYLLSIFHHILRNPRQSGKENPRALIVAPTRELAVQIASDANALGQYAQLSTHVVFGGIAYQEQRRILERGTDLLIGTPGRLIDYHKQHVYSLAQTEMVVIDECDRLFDMGFADDLRWLLRRLPPPQQRQSMMFSATLSRRVMTIGWRHMNEPRKIVICPERLTPETVTQVLYHVSSAEKLSLLLGVLAKEASSRTMVFVNTRYRARRLVEELNRQGYAARGLTGNVIQTKRLRVLDDFREGRLPILIATDVASRGLHIEGVSHVINYDLPQDPEDYVHRVGRTARAGATGKAITLCCEDYVYSLDAIHSLLGYEIPVAFAAEELYAPLRPTSHKRHPTAGRHQPAGRTRGRSSRSRRRGERHRSENQD